MLRERSHAACPTSSFVRAATPRVVAGDHIERRRLGVHPRHKHAVHAAAAVPMLDCLGAALRAVVIAADPSRLDTSRVSAVCK